METLRRQIHRARRRLLLEAFIHQLAFWLFGALIVAAVAVAIPKIWVIGVDGRSWNMAWLAGTTFAALVGALTVTWTTGARLLDAAMELDRRFGLKERLSSALALSEQEIHTSAGEAVLADASRRAQRIDVAEQFKFSAKWWDCLPLAPAMVVFLVLVLVPDAAHLKQAETNAASVAAKSRVTNSTQALQKKLAERKQLAEQQGLQDATRMFTELEKGVGQLRKNEQLDQKKALVKLNDLAAEIKKRRESLGDGQQLREKLNKLGNLKMGPGQKFARALNQGDLKKALSELDKLQAKLQQGQMSDAEQKQLAEQLKQMADRLNEMLANREQSKEALRQEINRLKEAGDLAKAGELQDKLDKLAAQDAQISQLAKLAAKMGESSSSLSKQDLQNAARQLAEMSENLSDLESTLQELQLLDDAMEQLADAKNSMACQSCQGKGCTMCQGSMGSLTSMGSGRQRGMGMGQGRGVGNRPEAETDKNLYDSQVRADARNGRGIITGFTSGPNVAGDAVEKIKLAIEAAGHADDDPLSGTRLPKDVRSHAQEYFDRLRDGE